MQEREAGSSIDAADEAAIARLLVDSVVDYAIFVLDPDGCVLTWNPGARRLKGYEADEIVGQHFSRFYREVDRRAGLPGQLLDRAREDGRVQHEGWRVRKGGGTFWGNVTITALREEDGSLAGFAKVTRDLTDNHNHQEAMRTALEREREAAAELARLHDTRTRFLTSVVHDLSSPITIIRSSARLAMAAPPDDADTPELLAGIARKADELEALTQQLREFARLENGLVTVDVAPVPLRPLVTELVRDLAVVHDRVRFDVEAPDELVVLADRLALIRVLTNLLTNAARFSPDGTEVRVLVELRGDEVAVGVADDGPGLDRDAQTHVFDEFWQGRPGRRHAGGLGLGLTIVKQYVDLLGGHLWVDSGLGEGATFWFTLDAAA